MQFSCPSILHKSCAKRVTKKYFNRGDCQFNIWASLLLSPELGGLYQLKEMKEYNQAASYYRISAAGCCNEWLVVIGMKHSSPCSLPPFLSSQKPRSPALEKNPIYLAGGTQRLSILYRQFPLLAYSYTRACKTNYDSFTTVNRYEDLVAIYASLIISSGLFSINSLLGMLLTKTLACL